MSKQMKIKEKINCFFCHIFNTDKTSEETHRYNFPCACGKIVRPKRFDI